MPAKDLVPFSTYLKPATKKKLEKIAAENFRSAAAEARLAIEKHVKDQSS
jgi:hypothetical protein